MLEVRCLAEKYKYLPDSIIAMEETAVCLSAKADGKKLKPFIVFIGEKREVEALIKEFQSRCIVASSSNPWMNKELTVNYVERVVRKFSFIRHLLLWDSFKWILSLFRKAAQNIHRILIYHGISLSRQIRRMVEWQNPSVSLLKS